MKIGVKQWFKSNIDTIKQYTQYISKDGDDEDDQEPASSSQQADGAGAEKLNASPSSEELNKLKFVPHVIHIERSILPRSSAFKLWELIIH